MANGAEKHFNIKQLDWEKKENHENIYNVVDKLLEILNEGQLYYNEMSKYINDYYEKKKQITQNQKHKIKLISQRYHSEKIKKVILNSDKKNKILKNIENIKNNKISFNGISESTVNSLNINNLTMKTKLNNKKGRGMEEKYKKIVKKILNISQENFYDKQKRLIMKHKTRNSNRTISSSNIFKNSSLFISKTGKNITTNNYLVYLNKEKSFPQEKLTIINMIHSCKHCKSNNLRKIIEFNMVNNSNSNSNIKKENKKTGRNIEYKINLKKYNYYQNKSSGPFTSQSMTSLKSHIDFTRKSNEKYVKNRVRYIIKNTRLFFTKTHNLDKIVRKRRNNSSK